ncbi:MAG TPA: exodeoxyribonuclease III [Flavobacteriales bacterium]|jgi:exodeoxyribonuclease-3|nr:exodeoxyribonuclease III [Salibacteraceae bacterium]HAS35949.1 exodeoxyribonuclease III [Flavobacteriales bacterium]
MRIISYNVNGIRAALKKDFIGWLKAADPDVLCLQEIKANIEQIPVEEFENLGYEHVWFSAEKKGYSGVAILSKVKPKRIEVGCGIDAYDREGRILRADFDGVSVLSCYFPSGSSGDERQAFKMRFLKDFQGYINKLKKEFPNLVISGDVNICHEAIDIHNPVRLAKTSGFLPEEREWVSSFLDSGFVDSFRQLNDEPHQYSWWSYRAGARGKNLGWRIDYHFTSRSLRDKISRVGILSQAKHSDHCPILLELDL